MFSSFAGMYNDYYFSFDNENKYQEIRNGEVRVFGTYKVNSSNQSIDVLYGNGGQQKPANFKFRFVKNNLILYLKSPLMDDALELTLERSP